MMVWFELVSYSGQGEGLGQSNPEPGLSAGPGVVTHSQESQNAGKRFLHRLVYHRDKSFAPSTYEDIYWKGINYN